MPNCDLTMRWASAATSTSVARRIENGVAIEANLQRALKAFPFMAVDRVFEDVSSEFYYPRTDAGPYLERGIPIMQFFNGLHPEYHRATDDVAKLDIAKITNVSKLSFGALWLAADDPATPKWDGIIPMTLWWVKPKR